MKEYGYERYGTEEDYENLTEEERKINSGLKIDEHTFAAYFIINGLRFDVVDLQKSNIKIKP